MKTWGFPLLLLTLFLLSVLYFRKEPTSPEATPVDPPETEIPLFTIPLSTLERPVTPEIATQFGPPVRILDLTDELNDPGQTAAGDVAILHQVFRQFRRLYQTNPVGDESEILRALTGANPKQVAFIPPDSPHISLAGQLIDRWGNPFVFHAQSATEIEIRSMGPDEQPHTEDDVFE
ncbi:MAG: type II secretion system protein GspG [Verrucomicrobiota bacterium]